MNAISHAPMRVLNTALLDVSKVMNEPILLSAAFHSILFRLHRFNEIIFLRVSFNNFNYVIF